MAIYYGYLIISGLVYLLEIGHKNSTVFSEKQKNRVAFVFALGMILVFGLRGVSVGIDTYSYYYRYTIYENMLHSARYASEFGFNIYNYILAKAGLPWQLYLFITSTIFLVILYRFFRKYSKNIYFSVFIFVTIGSFSMAMSGMRQYLSATLCLLSYMMLEEGKYHKVKSWIIAITIWLIAISFHNSAIIFFLYFAIHIAKLRLTKKQVLIGVIIAAFALVYGRVLIRISSIIIPNRYQGINLDKYYAINPLIILISVSVVLFSLTFSKTEEDGRYSIFMSQMFLFSILNIMFICLSVRSNQIGRLLYYFSNANAVLIPNAISDTHRNNKKVIYPILIALCLIYFHLGSVGGTLAYDKYVFFWMQ